MTPGGAQRPHPGHDASHLVKEAKSILIGFLLSQRMLIVAVSGH